MTASSPAPSNPLGAIQKAIGEKRFDEAIQLAEALVAASPGSHEGWNALGVGLRASGKPVEALGCYRRALDIRPGDLAATGNLANALKDLQRYREAIELHQRVVSSQPTTASWTNLGVALHDGGYLADALAAFDQAVRLDPENASAHFDRAQILLRLGRYAEGWKAFEWRWRLADRPPMPNYPTPVWDGRALPDGALLVWPEQGFGDSILSMRFLPAVRRRVKRIAVGCKPELLRLFQGVAGVDELVPVGKVAPPHAAHIPVMGLAGHAMSSLADLPPPARMHVPPESKARLAPLVERAGRRLKVGIVWSGSVTFKGNAHRAVPLDRFLAFAEVPNVQLFSLQKGPRAADLAACGARNYIVDLGAQLEDFADTAAALELLDLVVMTDSSVAHLAGSLGRPIWNLLPFMAYWLYLDGRSDSPWYPSMRLFRQRQPGDWDGVFAEAKSALAELARRHAQT
ncbi:MAG: glycosyltransferase family protein [Alphaproteobacteria bacterium]|nr:glycosyltransferase family protein [Alphaproteobacteria bacterium]